MYRSLFLLVALFCTTGCGSDSKVIEPTNVPETPKGPPAAVQQGKGSAKPQASSEPIKP